MLIAFKIRANLCVQHIQKFYNLRLKNSVYSQVSKEQDLSFKKDYLNKNIRLESTRIGMFYCQLILSIKVLNFKLFLYCEVILILRYKHYKGYICFYIIKILRTSVDYSL